MAAILTYAFNHNTESKAQDDDCLSENGIWFSGYRDGWKTVSSWNIFPCQHGRQMGLKADLEIKALSLLILTYNVSYLIYPSQ